MRLSSKGCCPAESDQLIYTCHWQISRVRHQSHFLLIGLPRAAGLDRLLFLNFVVERSGNKRTRKRADLQTDEMGFRMLHPEVYEEEEEWLVIYNSRPYHMYELSTSLVEEPSK